MNSVLVAQVILTIYASTTQVSSATYTPECDLTPKFVEQLPIVNPNEAYYGDGPTDCRLLVFQQIQELPLATGYRATITVNGEESELSSIFSRVQVEPPPPPIPTCKDGATTYSSGDHKSWQWKPMAVKQNITKLLSAGWGAFERKKLNKQWEWWYAICIGLP